MRFVIGSHPSEDAARAKTKLVVGLTTFIATNGVVQAAALAMHARGKH